jgi:hypothetical protein
MHQLGCRENLLPKKMGGKWGVGPRGAHTPRSSLSAVELNDDAVRGYFFLAVHSTSRSIIWKVPFMVAPSTVPL